MNYDTLIRIKYFFLNINTHFFIEFTKLCESPKNVLNLFLRNQLEKWKTSAHSLLS